MAFQPDVDDAVTINKTEFLFTAHPSAKSMPYGQTGRRATVYQVKAHDGSLYALKVFTRAFRSPRHAENADRLRPFASLPGLEVCERTVITPQNESSLIKNYPDLTFAVLMPWVKGETWQEFMLAQRSIATQQCHELARSLALILSKMEERGIAHCDLSGPNVMVSALMPAGQNQGERIALVDVDDLFAPNLPPPEKLPGGSPGYAHKTAPQGLWSAEADRFSATVLLVEMLTWCNERIRKQAFGEQFFDPSEIQKDCTRYHVMLETLGQFHGAPLEDAFRRAWQSEMLNDCLPLSKWAEILDTSQSPATEVVVPDAGFVLPTFKPDFKPIEDIPAHPESPPAMPSPTGAVAPISPAIQGGTSSAALAWTLVVLFGLSTLILGILYFSCSCW